MQTERSGKARYVMIGGFLGAGKSTAMVKLAQHLTQQGLRVGLITNDQSVGLADTAMLASHGFPVEEIAGGCFCCQFDSLVEAADRLSKGAIPDVFIAEPVGSCTDLVASVSYPLRRIYGERYTIAPLSVMVDPIRAGRILGIEQGRSFSDKIIYVYKKQLEEADLIILNKCDLLDATRLQRLRGKLTDTFPRARVLICSARDDIGLSDWFAHLTGDDLGAHDTMELDYEVYADGEALLGWLNCTVGLASEQPFAGDRVLERIARRIQSRLSAEGIEIAHLKMTLTPSEGNDLAAISLVRSDCVPELSHTLADLLQRGQLIVNLRAEADPETLREVTTAMLTGGDDALRGITANIEHLESFRPPKPTPTYRIEKAECPLFPPLSSRWARG